MRSTSLALGLNVGLYVEIYTIRGIENYWAKLDFNPSRIVDPAGYGLCEVTDLPCTTGMAWDKACGVLTPACGIDEARIKRLDVGRDGTCSDPAMYLDAIFRVPAAYARERTLWADASTGQSGTLYVGGKTTGRVSLYSKYMNSPAKAKHGEWRFEVQAREGWLDKPGRIKALADVSTDSVRAFLKDRWDWLGMSTAVKAKDQWIRDLFDQEIVINSSGDLMTDSKKERFVGYVTCLNAGRAPGAPSNARMAEYRRVASQVGIFLSCEKGPLESASVRHLDFETGTEVVRAA